MENSTVSGLRSRSRSKTPFLRSSCDRDSCPGDEGHTHQKSGRKTPIRRSTPVKQLQKTNKNGVPEALLETEEEFTDPPAHRTRQSTKTTVQSPVKTSDYSSDENLDRLKGNGKESYQNEINAQFERVTTSSYGYSTLADFTLSPIHASNNATRERSMRFGSPAYSACSTDSSFAEQALADTSSLLDKDSSLEHLPYRLYKMAGEYWNKYPKTDYTYSPLSKDRVELAPGQVAVPNMSRRSLSQFRVQGPNTTADEVDLLASTRYRRTTTAIESSDDEEHYKYRGYSDDRWWITRLLVTMITSITTTVSNAYRKVVGPSHRYPYTERRPVKEGIVTRAASAVAAPFYWIYTVITGVVTTTVTTTVTTITETITPSHVSKRDSYATRREEKSGKGSRWPWILLFLLPFIGYGCYYNWENILPQENVIQDSYKPHVVREDEGLSRRVAALEKWSEHVDIKLSTIDSKLSQFANLEAQIEQYSLKHLQQNLIQIFNMDGNGEEIAAKLKQYFDQHYLSKSEKQVLSQEIHERLISSWKPEMDEDKIRQMIQQYLAVFERKQLELIVEKVKEYVRSEEVRVVHTQTETGFDPEAVRRIVAGMLDVYDADKTGIVDYALESAGGQVLSTRCTELYQIKTKQYSILGMPVWWVFTSPRHALTPGAMPAECWAFQGFPGYLVVKTYAIIEVTGFSLEHMSRLLAVEGKVESAPKNFSVYGLQGELDPDPHLFGEYQYDANGTAIQYFPVQYPKTTDIGGVEYPVAYDIIELRVESNHGNPTYTCVYRFRVHGNPLSDIRQATEDSIRESEY